MNEEKISKRPNWLVIAVVALPAWVIVSATAGVWHRAQKENAPVVEEPKLLVQEVSTTAVADDLKKLTDWIGERRTGDPETEEALRSTGNWIEGSLGPGNVGHEVRRVQGPGAWPLLHVTQRGKDPRKPAQWVIAGYDSRPGSAGVEANGTGVAAVLAAARALAGDETEASVHYLFLPHVSDMDSPVLETAEHAVRLIRAQGEPGRILVVEAMGSGPPLWFSSRASDAIPATLTEGLGEIKGAEVVCLGDDADLASILFEMGLPAHRVSTRPLVAADEADEAPAEPVRVAAAAEALLHWIRRCAMNP